MYTLFDITEKDRRYRINIPKFTHVRDVLCRETEKVVDYYRFHTPRIPSNHLLIKLIHSLNVSMSRELPDYVATVEDKTDMIAKTFKFIHPTNSSATTFDGTFYNENTVEYIVASEEPFNIALAWEKWRSIVPVKIHSHPFSDMSIGIPNGNYPNHMTKGSAVISINIPMLALQYRAWVWNEQNRGETSRSLESFVSNYVLTNMIKRHTEICLVNRTINFCTERPISEFTRQHPFMVVDYSGKVDEVLVSRDKYLSQRKADFKQLFLVYDTLYFDSWAEVLALPKIAPTRHVSWLFLLSYLPYIYFYLAVIQKQDSRLDRELAVSIKRHIGYMENTQLIPTNIDQHSNILLQEIKNLLVILGA